MKRIIALIMVVLVLAISGCKTQEAVTGENVEWENYKCSTVDPKLIEKCCASQNADKMMIQCEGKWVIENDACKYECSTEGDISVDTADNTQLANPASVFCERQGYSLEIREEAGGQVGYCVFPDGNECEEWSFKRGDCGQNYVKNNDGVSDGIDYEENEK